MTIEITKTTPVYRDPTTTGIFLQWVVSNTGTKNVGNFKVERSGSPEGPFELVVENLDSFNYFDSMRSTPAPVGTGEIRENLNFLSLSRAVYYRVTVTYSDASTEDAVRLVSGNIRQRKIFLLKRKIQRDVALSFKFNGRDLAILKRRHWGLRCKDCFDPLTKRVTRSKCITCYGTGFEGGYFAPVRLLGRIGVQNVQSSITQQDKADINKKRLTILDYPVLEIDDLVVDVESNQRYIVQSRHSTELQTSMVHQQITISELARDSIEYRIPANLDHVPLIY